MFMTCVLGDETLGDQGSTTEEVPVLEDVEEEKVIDRCFRPPEVRPLTREDMLWSEPSDCIISFQRANPALPNPENASVEVFQEVMKAFCDTKQMVRRCFADLTQNVSVPCLNRTQQDLFAIHLENHVIGLEVACTRDGELTAVTMHELMKHSKALNKCLDLVSVGRRLNKDVTVLKKIYENVVAFRRCLGLLHLDPDLDPDHDDNNAGINAAQQLINEYLSKMNCHNPGSGEVVLCSGLVRAGK